MSATTIEKLLIANRGEIARRIMRTCRAMGIATVAVFADADREAAFVQEADEAVGLGGNLPAESYLSIDKLLAAAQRAGADAVHPGYGFLAENADFARACAAASMTFVGPQAEAIAAMGSKIEAKRRMQAAGVPVLPSVDVGERSAEQVLKEVEALGWPVLVKASAGGGGRGMRIVRQPGEFAALLTAARSEAGAAFGDATVFVEPYVEGARHVEVQIFGDAHGNVVHLFERECSIQRRHQKVIEESPSPAVTDDLREEMTAAAVRAGQAIGYVNAGTVEFLLRPGGKFYFLEVNTRLQVEHPVTECVTGLDLVRVQLQVASGLPLTEEVRSVRLVGHAIEARLCAEDPRHDYRPSAGAFHRLAFARDAGVRVDAAIDDQGIVPAYYDSLVAKVVAHGATRAEAARALSQALASAEIHGLCTNRELLVRVLRHPEFLSGQIDTHFLERHDAQALAAPLGGVAAERMHALAAALAGQAARRAEAKVLRAAPSGWRNNSSQMQRTRFQGELEELEVEYQFGRAGLRARVAGEVVSNLTCVSALPDAVRLAIDGIERTFRVQRSGENYYVDSPLGSSALVEVPRFPLPTEQRQAGSLVAPLPGVVHEVKARVGDVVAEGDVVLVIESMKVHHWIAAPHAGTVTELRVASRQHVESGAVLAVIQEAS